MWACLRAASVLAVLLLALPLLAAADDAKGDKTKPDGQADKKPKRAQIDLDLPAPKGAKEADKNPAKAPAKGVDVPDPKGKNAPKDEKKVEKGDKAEKGEKKPRLVHGPVFMGKLKEMDSNSQKNFTVEIQIPVPSPEGQKALLQAQAGWAQRQAQLLRTADPRQRYQQAMQLQADIAKETPRLQAGLVKLQPLDVQLRAADNIRVRTAFPPFDYDEKGRPKVYTRKELKEMKGPENLPGFTAEYEALRAGQMVQVFLVKNQPDPGGKKGKARPKAKINLDDDPELARERRLEVIMIVILAEPKN
jgi:hypothetical protein